MNPMNDAELKEVVELANKVGMAQATLADHMNITDNYWYKIRSGRAPLTDDVLNEIRKVKRKLKAFIAA
jgi:ribosome-binding protein aMBF1 (putative translation factor)